jgi:hypothetical protein
VAVLTSPAADMTSVNVVAAASAAAASSLATVSEAGQALSNATGTMDGATSRAADSLAFSSPQPSGFRASHDQASGSNGASPPPGQYEVIKVGLRFAGMRVAMLVCHIFQESSLETAPWHLQTWLVLEYCERGSLENVIQRRLLRRPDGSRRLVGARPGAWEHTELLRCMACQLRLNQWGSR